MPGPMHSVMPSNMLPRVTNRKSKRLETRSRQRRMEPLLLMLLLELLSEERRWQGLSSGQWSVKPGSKRLANLPFPNLAAAP